jgi:hypothetical protein
MVHLRSLPSVEPVTSTGRVLWMWPEIEAGIASGKTVKEIWQAAQRDAIGIPYPQFRVYVSRIRRRNRVRGVPVGTANATAETARTPAANDSSEPKRPVDPLHNVRVQLEKKRQSTFEYNPFPDGSKPNVK